MFHAGPSRAAFLNGKAAPAPLFQHRSMEIRSNGKVTSMIGLVYRPAVKTL
jgi:hypothetical protein